MDFDIHKKQIFFSPQVNWEINMSSEKEAWSNFKDSIEK